MPDNKPSPRSIDKSLLMSIGLPLLLATIAFLVYWPSLKSDFVYDARMEILDEGFITSISNLPDVLTFKVLGMNLLIGGRPGQLLYLMLIASVCGKTPFGYHLCSNFLHAINVALVFVLLRRLIRAEFPEMKSADLWKAHLAAVAVTLIFALHPITVEPVSALSYSSDLLVTFFTLLALLTATAFHPENALKATLLGIVGVLCAFAAVTCKESGVAAAGLLVVYWFLFRRNEGRRGSWVLFMAGAMGISMVFLFARFLFVLPSPIPLRYIADSFPQFILIQSRLWAFMIHQMAWPLYLSADYAPDETSGPSVFISILILTIVILLQGWLVWKSRIGAFGVAVYWLGLVAVSNFFPLYRPVADRFYYLPLVGVAVQLLALILMTLKSRRGFWVAVIPCFVALLPLTALTLSRQSVFADDAALWTNTLKVSPGSAISHNGLGLVFFQKEQYEDALVEFQKALQIVPNYPNAHDNLGNVLIRMGQLDNAIEEYRKAVEIEPNFARAQNNLGNALFEKGQLDEALSHLFMALAITPNDADIHYNLGNVLFQSGQVSEAIEEYQRALAINPEYAKAHDNLGNALVQTGQIEEAVTQYEMSLKIDPNNARTYNNLGTIYLQKKQFDDAVTNYQKALEIDPNYARVRSNLGIVFSQKGEMNEAIAQFQKALEINPDLPDAHENLGIALFKAGYFNDAIAQLQETVRLSPHDMNAQDMLKHMQAAAQQNRPRK